MSSKFKVLEVTGVAMYACVHKAKKGFSPDDIPTWCLDLVVSDETAKLLLEEGLKPAKVKIDEDTKKNKEYAEYPGQKVFAFRRRTHKNDGTEKTPPEVVDSETNRIPPNILIGNGSRVVVHVNPYTCNVKGKDIVCCELLGIQVLELVEYRPHGSFTPKSGFKVSSLTSDTSDHEDGDHDAPSEEFHPF